MPPGPASSGELSGVPNVAGPPTRALAWAVITGLLFFGWIGYLLYLVQTRPQGPHGGPVILSRPQFLISELDVIAQVDSLGGPVVVQKVVNPRSPEVKGLEGQPIIVTNLGKCHRLPRSEQERNHPVLDFTGPGKYILALRSTRLGRAANLLGLAADPAAGMLLAASQPPTELETAISYEVVPTPPSPGFPSPFAGVPAGPPRIYPAIPATIAQLEQIPKPE